jgi:hypothetical protein
MQGPLRGILAGAAAWKFGGGCISTILIFILVFWLLGKKAQKTQKEKSSFVPFCGYYQLTTSSSASCQTGRFGRIAQRYSLSG